MTVPLKGKKSRLKKINGRKIKEGNKKVRPPFAEQSMYLIKSTILSSVLICGNFQTKQAYVIPSGPRINLENSIAVQNTGV